MNKIYRVIWSEIRNCYVAVSEITKRSGKRGSSVNRHPIAAYLAATCLIASCSVPASSVLAANSGGTWELGNYVGTAPYQVIVDSDVAGNIYGNRKWDADIHGASVTMTGGTAYAETEYGGTVGNIYGGFTDSGNTVGNTVIFSGRQVQNIYGGYSIAGGMANENTVTINGGTIMEDVMGGYTGSSFAGSNGVATKNKVIVAAGTVHGNIFGGLTVDGENSQNTVEIKGGTLNNFVIGGFSDNSGLVTKNNVEITAGTIIGPVYGGESEENGDVTGNTVTISNGTINGNVYGGGSDSGNVTGNTVTIRGGSFDSQMKIVGGETKTGTVSDNTVNILSRIAVNEIAGGKGTSPKTLSGNTLNLAAKGVTTSALTGFQNLNFYLPADITNGDTMLSVIGEKSTDLKNVTYGVTTLAKVNLTKGDTVNLIYNTKGLETDASLKTAESSSLGTASFLTPNNLATDNKYDLSISKKDSNTIIATVENITSDDTTPTPAPTPDPPPRPDPVPAPTPTSGDRLKSLVEPRAAAITLLNSGTDLLEGQGMRNAADAAITATPEDGFVAFAAGRFLHLRGNSGSHVDVNGTGFNLGFAREIKNRQGRLLFGPVAEYGRGNYDSYVGSLSGDGSSHYWGLGFLARQTNNNGLYYEGSLRGGRVNTDYSGALSSVTRASYDSRSNYLAAHLGIGRIMETGPKDTIDYYGKYFYSHTGGDTVTVHATGGAEKLDFSAVNSHRLRLGARLTHAVNKANKVYGGAAWQYEFNGEARAAYNGTATPSPSIKGSSAFLEVGWQVKPGKSPMTIDFGVTGWTGKQQGIAANLQANWNF